MNPSEDQLRRELAAAPGDWTKRLQLVECLANRWAGQELDMLLTASPNAPATEAEMRRVVDLANAQCPGYRGLKHVLGLFLQTHLTSSWAHFIQAQALLYTGDDEAALRHYQTSRSLNPSRSDDDLDKLLADRAVPAPASAGAHSITPVPPRQEKPESSIPEKEKPAGEIETVPEKDAEPSAGVEAESPSNREPVAAKKSSPGEEPEAESEAGSRPDPGESEDENSESGADATKPEDREEEIAATDAEGPKPGTDSQPVKVEKNPEQDEVKDSEGPFHIEALGEDGELVKAAKKEDDSRDRLSALSIALIVHVLALLAFAFWYVVKPAPTPPMFVSSEISDGDEEQPERPEIKRYQRPQMPAPTAQMKVMTTPAVSVMTMPEMSKSVATFDPIGNSDEFGLGMAMGGGGGGGSVSFFGSKTKSARVVFVVDVSASMGGSKDVLMRQELKRTIEGLSPNVEYALIFFGGPAWFAGQKPGEAGLDGQWVANVVRDGNQKYVWYEGWSEKERHTGSRTSALYHYSLGEQNLPRGRFRKATRSNLRQTVDEIQQTPLVFGTDWRWGLKMAMNMKPDTIFFMTDGAFGTGSGVTKDDMIRDLLEHNRKNGNSRINTVCMMVLQARKELEQLARGSQGEFTLVRQDGSTARGSDLDDE